MAAIPVAVKRQNWEKALKGGEAPWFKIPSWFDRHIVHTEPDSVEAALARFNGPRQAIAQALINGEKPPVADKSLVKAIALILGAYTHGETVESSKVAIGKMVATPPATVVETSDPAEVPAVAAA
jgi:hypothetical protein